MFLRNPGREWCWHILELDFASSLFLDLGVSNIENSTALGEIENHFIFTFSHVRLFWKSF